MKKNKLNSSSAIAKQEALESAALDMLRTRFFSFTYNPIANQQLEEAVVNERTVELTHVPDEELGCLLLLDAIAQAEGQVPLVEDFGELKQLVREATEKEVPSFWHPEGFLINGIAYGTMELDNMGDVPELWYVFRFYRALRALGKEKRNGHGGK